MEYRLNRQALLATLEQWNSFLKRKVHLIACGGTALTLLDVKPSTKDVDFMVPIESEYRYLIKLLSGLGYQQTTTSGWRRGKELFIFDIFLGKRIHTTELLQSPLANGQHVLLREFSHLYVGILNDYDLIASKLFRGTGVDFDDCLMLVKSRKGKIDVRQIERHVQELARYDISEQRILQNLGVFMSQLRKEGLDA